MAKERANRKGEEKHTRDDEIIEGEIVDEVPTVDPSEADIVDSEMQDSTSSALAEELQQAQVQAKEYFDGWQRERADFANYKRRVDRDQQMMALSMKGDVIKKYLTVIDDLDRALKHRPVDGAAGSWANGIELISRKLHTILEAEGVQTIGKDGDEFNPNIHEAITLEESPEHESGHIIEVVQQGYSLGDRVLRPAMVRVAR